MREKRNVDAFSPTRYSNNSKHIYVCDHYISHVSVGEHFGSRVVNNRESVVIATMARHASKNMNIYACSIIYIY